MSLFYTPDRDVAMKHSSRTAFTLSSRVCLILEGSSDFRVEHKDKRSSHGTERVGTGSLEEGGGSFLLDNLLEAVSGSLVDPLFLWLLRLHLQTTTDGVEWVGNVSSTDGGCLGADELGSGTHQVVFALLVRVVSRKSIEESEVGSTVRDDTNNRDTNTVVKTSNTRRGDGLLDTVRQTIELGLSSTDIRGKTGTGVIQGVDDHEGSGSGKTSRGDVDHEELGEFSVLVGFGEHGLDSILESKVEGLGREVTDDVGEVTTPESLDSLFLGDTGEAVNDTSVTCDLSTDNLGVSILGLDQKLNTLDRSSGGLGNGSRDTSGHKVDKEIRRHCCRIKRAGLVTKKYVDLRVVRRDPNENLQKHSKRREGQAEKGEEQRVDVN
mmetsp:Transcript_28542/g.69173  ORF Transcript_28542/g.69173 Transcript_28542/m.69173 type:complete len:380 (+) Transcript_28542:39-1178(+)